MIGGRPHWRRCCVWLLLSALSAACGATSAPPAPGRTRASDIMLEPDGTIIDGRIPSGSSLDAVLRSHHVDDHAVPLIVAATRSTFDPRMLRAGQPYRLVLGDAGLFRSFEYTIDRDHYLRVEPTDPAAPDGLAAAVREYPTERRTEAIAGAIDAAHPSLVSAMDEAGATIELALQMAQVFGGQVDFNADLQPGDRFEILYEKLFHEGRFSGYGAIEAAALENDGRRMQAFRFAGPDGKDAYFDESGRSVRRFFLPSPLPFDPRVTSRFSQRRMHPVLGVTRAHLGVDYAAATGTPVLAVARGVVVSAGWSGGSGRMVRLRHANGYETYYLHLSAITKGLRPGSRVDQGDVVGRVGATGLATGPHLDFRVSRQGRFVNPLTERRNMPAGEPIPSDAIADFEAVRDRAIDRLTQAVEQGGVLNAALRPAGR